MNEPKPVQQQAYVAPVLKHLGPLTTITQAGSMMQLEGMMMTNMMRART